MQDLLQLLINISYAVPAAMNLVMVLAALIGLVLTITALIAIWQRSMIGMQGGGDSTSLKSIFGRIFIGVILTSSLYWLNISGNTLLLGRPVNGQTFLYQTAGMSEAQRVALQAVFDLIALVGYIGFIKGWLLLQKFFDNVIREWGKAAIYIIFGTLAVYLDEVLEVAGNFTGIHFVGTVLF